LCALIYQVAWLRELRLIFGGSTAATAAVLAIFMGGLGLGGLLLGNRADKHHNPLALYAILELLIAASAATTPFLVEIVRGFYISLGGSAALGVSGATSMRLVLAILVLGVPTFLMGGTLPAAAKAVAVPEPIQRCERPARSMGWSVLRHWDFHGALRPPRLIPPYVHRNRRIRRTSPHNRSNLQLWARKNRGCRRPGLCSRRPGLSGSSFC
jgi:hypothetical protein